MNISKTAKKQHIVKQRVQLLILFIFSAFLIILFCVIFAYIKMVPATSAEPYIPHYSSGQKLNLSISGFKKFPKEILFSFFKFRNSSINDTHLRYIIHIYLIECKNENINPVAAFVQMCLETNFLRFTGTVSLLQFNFAGIGTTSKTTPGHFFMDNIRGVQAQIQHLKAYSSKKPLNKLQVDPRFHLVTRGSAPGILDLSGKWASDKKYGESLLRLTAELYSFLPPLY